MKVPGGPDPEVGGTIRQVRCSSTGHFQMKSISISSARAAPTCPPSGSRRPHFPGDPYFKCPWAILPPSQGSPRQPLSSNSPQARPQNRRARSQWCFVTQTCIRFIHKTAWFPKTIQTACSSAGSWPWARGPRPPGAPGHPPPPAGGHAKRPFLLLPSVRPEKKGLFSLREVARIGNIET